MWIHWTRLEIMGIIVSRLDQVRESIKENYLADRLLTKPEQIGISACSENSIGSTIGVLGVFASL